MKEIRKRLLEFRNLSEKQMFSEFVFCLLTPQSNAQRCWAAVLELKEDMGEKEIASVLKTRTRFHNVKAKRVVDARTKWGVVREKLKSERDVVMLRNWLAENVNGYGLKEASHFLRNVGRSDNRIAILDRHILKNLGVEGIKSKKNYLEIEKKFLDRARLLKIPADELDLLWWSRENGEIFK